MKLVIEITCDDTTPVEVAGGLHKVVEALYYRILPYRWPTTPLRETIFSTVHGQQRIMGKWELK